MKLHALEDHFNELLWNIDHGIAKSEELAYARWLGIDLHQAERDFPHYKERFHCLSASEWRS